VYDAVTLEDDVFCGPSMVFTNVYNPRSAVTRKNEYRRTLVRQGATLGANATLVCGITVGRHAFVGAGAVVQKDVPDFALMVGVLSYTFFGLDALGDQIENPFDRLPNDLPLDAMSRELAIETLQRDERPGPRGCKPLPIAPGALVATASKPITPFTQTKATRPFQCLISRNLASRTGRRRRRHAVATGAATARCATSR